MPIAPPIHRPPGHAARQKLAAQQHVADGAVYRLAKWRKFRRTILDREPLCRICFAAGIIEPATDVDHIERVKKNPASMFDPQAVQPLCHQCHSRKTATEERE